MKNIIFKIFFIVIGSLVSLNGIALFFVSNLNLGNFMTVVLGCVIILLSVFFTKMAKLFKFLILVGLCLVVVFAGSLIIYGKVDNVTYREDAVIVLGAAVHGKTPSLTLKKRLDTAIEYYTENPDSLIIVSGGKGAQEDITEAEAMQNYLVSHGVSENKIIKEENATSTYENFVFSKKLLDENLGNDYTFAFITNEYHILRANLCANEAGLKNITHAHSNTNLSYLISGSLRECLAVIKYIIFK